MKFLSVYIFTLALLTSVVSSAGDVQLLKLEDDTVSAALAENLSVVQSKDKVLSAKLLSVYRGSAYGVVGIIVTFLDQSSSEGDYPNTTSYELTPFKTYPKNVTLVKVTDKKYVLSFDADVVTMDEDAEYKATSQRTKLEITLSNEQAVESVKLQ